MTDYHTREDHQPYETPVVGQTTCDYCGATITQRHEGRTRRFCDATCRSGAYRRSSPRRSTKLGIKETKRQ